VTPERRAAEDQAAREYADRIRRDAGGSLLDWTAYNRAIIARWSLSALLRVKARAWRIVEGRER
jgi:hypothetical protein